MQEKRAMYTRKMKKERFFHWLRISMFVLAFFLLLAAAHTVLYSGFFHIRHIFIEGNRVLTPLVAKKQITRMLVGNDKWRAWFGPGSIFFWAFTPSRITFSQDAPLIEEASVRADFIKKDVRIHIYERKISGLWCLYEPENVCYAFDADGTAIGIVPVASGKLILKIYDENKRHIILGSRILTEKLWQERLFSVIRTVEELYGKVVSVRIKDIAFREFEIVSSGGPVFKFSFDFIPHDFEQVLSQLLSKLKTDNISYIDFRVQDRVYYRKN